MKRPCFEHRTDVLYSLAEPCVRAVSVLYGLPWAARGRFFADAKRLCLVFGARVAFFSLGANARLLREP